MLPFSREEFLSLFTAYNVSIWPAQICALAIGLAAICFIVWRSTAAGKIAAVGLSAMWLWTGLVYHVAFFSSINTAAFGFGAGFILQGLLFLRIAVVGDLRFGGVPIVRAYVGGFLMGYAIVLYPLIGILLGHRLIDLPSFGVTPCPLTIFTLGVLLLARPRVPMWLMVIPLLWSVIGGSAAFLLDVPQDGMLLVGGIAFLVFLRNERELTEASRDT